MKFLITLCAVAACAVAKPQLGFTYSFQDLLPSGLPANPYNAEPSQIQNVFQDPARFVAEFQQVKSRSRRAAGPVQTPASTTPAPVAKASEVAYSYASPYNTYPYYYTYPYNTYPYYYNYPYNTYPYYYTYPYAAYLYAGK